MTDRFDYMDVEDIAMGIGMVLILLSYLSLCAFLFIVFMAAIIVIGLNGVFSATSFAVIDCLVAGCVGLWLVGHLKKEQRL